MATQPEVHVREEIIDELLGSSNIKTQDDLFGKDGLLKNITKVSVTFLL